eukprot:UN02723
MSNGRKRKLEISDDEAIEHYSSSDGNNASNHNKKRVKFDQSVNADSSNDKYNKYESSSINLSDLSNCLKVRVGDNEHLKHFCDNNIENNKELWLFHFPPGFDESTMNNLKLSIPKHPKIGERIALFRINKRRYQIIEYDCSRHNIVNLFAVDYSLKIGQPFKRHFHILPDLGPSPSKRKKNKISIINENEDEDELLFGDGNEINAPQTNKTTVNDNDEKILCNSNSFDETVQNEVEKQQT